MSTNTVLFDVPGPRARVRHRLYSALTVLAFLTALAVVYLGFNRSLGEGTPPVTSAEAWTINPEGQWAAEKWRPFIDPATWTDYLLPGLQNTLTAALWASILAIAFGLVFGIARLSDHRWVRVLAGTVVEFFRGIPLLILIFFTMALPIAVNQLLPVFGMDPLTPGVFQVSALAAVVTGLTLYNGSVLAEVFRAGINAVPRGQAEAAYSLGMTKTKVMWLVLLPQAVSAMMPAIVAQLVVLLKDSALGYIVAFQELLRGSTLLATRESNVIPAAIVAAGIYIAINLTLSRVAVWLERRNAQRGRTRRRPTAAATTRRTADHTEPGDPEEPGAHQPPDAR